jgi:hypothetical protein
MGRVHVVVDGSNIATEGRTAPSLAQLDEAVRSFIDHYGHERVTVIVDATFGHRIDASESEAFEEAILAGELVTPPAGTIGRGDAFILEVARRADADVLSNDSFQELHAEHPWLFEPGRLWGGKPVPSVGWVFVARAPVRGVTSRRVTQAAKRASKAAAAPKVEAVAEVAAEPVATPAAEAGEVASTTAKRRSRRRGGSETKREPVNEQFVYAAFVVDHPVGSVVRGTVERFSSHGAYVLVNGASAYIPLRALGDPPPRSAREVLSIGEERDFTVTRFDPAIRGIDVVPADVDALTTSPPEGGEAVAPAAVASEPDAEEAPVPTAKKSAAKKRSTAKKATARKSVAKKAPAKRAAAKKAAPRKKAAAKKTAAKKKSTAKKATARKSTAKKSTAKKSTAKKSTAKKSTAKRAAKKR